MNTQFLLSPLGVLALQDWQLGWDIGRLFIVIGTLLVAHKLSWSPLWAVAAYGLSMFISYLFLFGLSLRALSLRGERTREDAEH